MSSNVEISFRVTNVPDADRASAVVAAIRAVLRRHGIDNEIVIKTTDAYEVVGETTPYPIIVSRISGPWVEEVKNDITSAAVAAEPSVTCRAYESYPDLENDISLMPVDESAYAQLRSVAYDPTGRLLAGAHHDGVVRIWDAETGQIRHVIGAHTKSAEAVAFSPDGQRLATGGGDHQVRIWAAETGKQVEADQLSGHHRLVRDVAFHPDGRVVASCGYDGHVRLWDIEDDIRSQWLTSHRHWVNRLSFHPDGSRIASASHDKKVRVWNTTTGRCVRALANRPLPATSVAYSPDGAYLAVGSEASPAAGYRGRIIIWETAGWTEVAELRHRDGYVRELEYSADGSHLAALAFSGGGRGFADRAGRDAVEFWSMPSGTWLHAVEDERKIVSFALSPDGKRMVTGHRDDGSLALRDATTGEVIRSFPESSS